MKSFLIDWFKENVNKAIVSVVVLLGSIILAVISESFWLLVNKEFRVQLGVAVLAGLLLVGLTLFITWLVLWMRKRKSKAPYIKFTRLSFEGIEWHWEYSPLLHKLEKLDAICPKCSAELTADNERKNGTDWPVARCKSASCGQIIEINEKEHQHLGSVACAAVIEIQRICRRRYKKAPEIFWPIEVNQRKYSKADQKPFI